MAYHPLAAWFWLNDYSEYEYTQQLQRVSQLVEVYIFACFINQTTTTLLHTYLSIPEIDKGIMQTTLCIAYHTTPLDPLLNPL